jgi:hypothetical protein
MNLKNTKYFKILITILLVSISQLITAQTVQNYTVTNSVGTYTPLGGTATTLMSGYNDDVASALTNIGFTFTFNGTTFTQFSACSNGFIRLGALADVASAPYTPLSSNTAHSNVISAVGMDGNLNLTGGSIKYENSGGVLTIEFNNFGPYAATPGSANNYNFQIKLYQTTNVVEIVYGSFTMATGVATSCRVGLRGGGTSTTEFNTKMGGAAFSHNFFWQEARRAVVTTSTILLNSTVTPQIKPNSGLTFTFSPAPTSNCLLTALPARTQTATTATFTYTLPAGVTSYKIRYRDECNMDNLSVSTWTTPTVMGASPWILSGLVPGRRYEYQIAKNTGTCLGPDEWYGPVQFTTTASTCTTPTVTITALGSTTASLQMSAGGIGMEYYYGLTSTPIPAGSNCTGAPLPSSTLAGTTLNLTGLLGSTNYTVWWRRACGAGDSSNWAGFTFNTRPINDSICNAIPIFCGSSGLAGSSLNCTSETTPDCAVWSGVETPRQGVWYVLAGNDSAMTIDLCHPTSYDSRISVYRAATCSDPLICVAANDDIGASCAFAGGFPSKVTFNAYSGNNYYILVHGYAFGAPSATGNFVMTISCEQLCLPEPTNDICADAATISMVDYGTCTPTVGSTRCASPLSLTPGVGGYSAFGTYRDVWYRFQATSSTAIIRIDSTTTGRAANIGFALYANDTCGPIAYLGQANSIYNFEYTIPGLIVGNFYRLQVTSDMGVGSGGGFRLCVTKTPPPAPNDTICRAVVLSGLLDNCTSPIAGSVAYGSNSGISLTPCAGTAFNDMWYKFVANRTSYNLNIDNGGSGQTFYAQVLEAPACSGPYTSMTCVTTFPSNIDYLVVGQTYYIRVYTPFAVPGASVSGYTVCLKRNPLPPANDNMCLALDITSPLLSTSPYASSGFLDINTHADTIRATNVLATRQAGEPLGTCGLPGPFNRTMWYKIKAPFCATPQLIISTHTNTTDFDTRLSVYRRSDPNVCLSTYTEIACNDDGAHPVTGGFPLASTAILTPNSATPTTNQYAPGEDLFVQVTGFDIESGNYGLIVDLEPTVPTVGTIGAGTAVVDWSAVLAPTWGSISGAYIQWRPVGAPASVSGTWVYVAGPTSTHTITGLMPGTAYEVWASYVCGNGGRWWSKKATFTTNATCTVATAPTITSIAPAPPRDCRRPSVTISAPGIEFSSYKIVRKRGSTLWYSGSYAPSASITYVDSRSLTYGLTYQYYIVGYCGTTIAYTSPMTNYTACSASRMSDPSVEETDVVYTLPTGEMMYGLPFNEIAWQMNEGEGEINLQTTDANTYFGREVVKEAVVAKVGAMSIYPNPATSEATISYTLEKEASSMVIRVMDAQGKEMMNETIANPEVSGIYNINLNNYSAGIYFVRIQAGDYTDAKKLVVDRR